MAADAIRAAVRLRCRIGRHVWGLWQRDTTPMPLFKTTDRKGQVGWEYMPITGPTYRYCKHCPAMERKT